MIPRVSHLSDARQIALAVNAALRKTDALALSSDQTVVEVDRDVDVTGDVNVSGAYSVDGTQVVGAQQTAIADDASGAANQATVNAILAALRQHGLIAT